MLDQDLPLQRDRVKLGSDFASQLEPLADKLGMQARCCLVLLQLLLAFTGCHPRGKPLPSKHSLDTMERAAATTPASSPGPVWVEPMPVTQDIPAFVLRGSRGGETVGVVLHGYCGHGLGVLQAFQFAAAETGPFIALQGDRPCGSSALRAWSGNIEATDRRIDAALKTYLGDRTPGQILLGGSSQGADIAIRLARRFPEKYRFLFLMGVYKADTARGLKQVERAHFLVGQYENPWPTLLTAQRWRAAGLEVGFTTIAGAGHSDFHGLGNPMMLLIFKSWGVAV